MAAVGGADPAAVQADLAQLRVRLLGGRGHGASSSEVERHTRGRVELAGRPT